MLVWDEVLTARIHGTTPTREVRTERLRTVREREEESEEEKEKEKEGGVQVSNRRGQLGIRDILQVWMMVMVARRKGRSSKAQKTKARVGV